jgi:N-acetylmuramic acid 6-phosphate etherase
MSAHLRKTESELPESSGIDTWNDADILGAFVAGQERAIAAVKAAIPQISKAANAVAACLAGDGRLFYAGAGTSIRIGVQDGSELPATFGMAEDRIVYLIAGSRAAMFETLADAEDDAEEGHRAASVCKAGDAVIVIAASGSTPYTIAVAKRARELGASVIAVVNNPTSALAAAADIEVFLDSGPEVIMGSTRMGAGTAQKAALNLLSTLTHIKLGAVHDGMMVNVRADNLKLKARARGIVSRIAKANEKDAAAALEISKGEVKPAVLICVGAKSLDAAQKLLVETKGNLRLALLKLAATR